MDLVQSNARGFGGTPVYNSDAVPFGTDSKVEDIEMRNGCPSSTTNEISAPSGCDITDPQVIAYHSSVLVRFSMCDPAGIVFYPRYFETFNSLVEDWCANELDLPFARLMEAGWGLPTVHMDADFLAPSFLGEILIATLSVRNVGKSSIKMEIRIAGPEGQIRVRGQAVLVLTDRRTNRAVALPADLRERILARSERLHS